MSDELRMDAYYYGFAPTGVREVDLVLNAVAWAGKAFHHTDMWTEEVEPYPDTRGTSCAQWIQNAATDAAAALTAERSEVARLKALHEECAANAAAAQEDLRARLAAAESRAAALARWARRWKLSAKQHGWSSRHADGTPRVNRASLSAPAAEGPPPKHPCACGHDHLAGSDGEDDGCKVCDCTTWRAPPAAAPEGTTKGGRHG